MGYSIGPWMIRILRAVQRVRSLVYDVSGEAKSLLGNLCEESVVFGQVELKN